MNSKLLSYLLLLAQAIAGVVILVGIGQINAGNNVKTTLVFAVLLLLNLVYAKVFHVESDLGDYWRPAKMYYFLIGAVCGLVLTAGPALAAILAGKATWRAIGFDRVTGLMVLFTFLITGWEELWFRSILLNYVSKHLSKVAIAIAVGVLFIVVHLLNPKINLLQEGPQLFLAGTLLTALYFYYRNIWLPVGLHFGNNLFGSVIHTKIPEHTMFGNEGYLYNFLLLVAAIYFLFKLGYSSRANNG